MLWQTDSLHTPCGLLMEEAPPGVVAPPSPLVRWLSPGDHLFCPDRRSPSVRGTFDRPRRLSVMAENAKDSAPTHVRQRNGAASDDRLLPGKCSHRTYWRKESRLIHPVPRLLGFQAALPAGSNSAEQPVGKAPEVLYWQDLKSLPDLLMA